MNPDAKVMNELFKKVCGHKDYQKFMNDRKEFNMSPTEQGKDLVNEKEAHLKEIQVIL